MINRYYSDSWDDIDENLKQAIQVLNKNQANAWRIQWEALNASESQTAFSNQSTAVFYYQPEKFACRGKNRSLSTSHISDSWDQYDDDLKHLLRDRVGTQAAFRHCLWVMMVSDESKVSCFLDCRCEGSGYRVTQGKAA